jgi:hypothetical protein
MIVCPQFLFRLRPVVVAAGLIVLSATAATSADAQTTIRMTTVQGLSCVAVTDANGLTLIPGGTDLQATGVTLTGSGCGGGGGSPPTSTNGLLLTAAPTTPVAGAPFSVSWNVSNATSCVGTVTSGTASNVSGWAEVSTPTSPRSVTISAAGSYGLVLTCSNANSSATLVSPVLALTVNPTGATCTVPGYSQLTTSNISYGAFPTPVRTAVDVTQWNNIWGHYNATDGVTPWPGVNGTGPVLQSFSRTNFVAAHFNTGNNSTGFGFFTFPDTNSLAQDWAISTTCGDFSPPQVGCSSLDNNIPERTTMYWYFQNLNNRYKCTLLPNTDYYLNIKYHDPNATDGCSGGVSVCPFPTLQQLN